MQLASELLYGGGRGDALGNVLQGVGMKKFLLGAVALLVSVSAYAQGDIKVSTCSKNSALLYVEITGESAMQILDYSAKRFHMTPAELLNIETNGMNCRTTGLLPSGEASGAICSYIMDGKNNIPYPQVDPGFSHEKVIECD